MVYLIGDIHLPIEAYKLTAAYFPKMKTLGENDFIVILGDFGLIWQRDKTFNYWVEILSNKKFTILFIDGNHDNHEWLNSFPIISWHGGYVHKITRNILHLMRGEIFNIDDKNYFVIGGAESYDKNIRQQGVDWWPEEIPSFIEMNKGINNLEAYKESNIGIHYVLTHTCPVEIAEKMFGAKTEDPTAKYLSEVRSHLSDNFIGWYFGHWHQDKIEGKFTCIYDKWTQLT